MATGIWGGMDISIVKLEKPIPLGQNVKKVELGTWDEFINHVLVSFTIFKNLLF